MQISNLQKVHVLAVSKIVLKQTKKDIIVKSIVSSLLHKIYNNRMYEKND